MGTFSVSGRVVAHSPLDCHNGQLHVVFFTAQLQVYEFLGMTDLVDLMVERFEVRSSQAPGAHVWDYNSDADSRTAHRASHAPAPKQVGKS